MKNTRRGRNTQGSRDTNRQQRGRGDIHHEQSENSGKSQLPDTKINTEIIAIDPEHPDPSVLARAGTFIREGKLVGFPTETVYGIGTDVFNAEAVARIFMVKGRAANDPVIVHVANLDQLETVASNVPPLVSILAAHFWPGPLTMILPRGAAVPLNVTAGLDTVAVRMPIHPVAYGLLIAAGTPVAAPSANLFTRPSATHATHVISDLAGRVDLILDAGPTRYGVESTVLDLTGTPRILRPGALTLEQLRTVLPDVLPPTAESASGAIIHRSPGTMLKHYSPQAEMLVFDGTDVHRVLLALAAAVEEAHKAGRTVGLLLSDEDLAHLTELSSKLGLITVSLGPAADLGEQARRLFAALRNLDRADVDLIATRMPAPTGLGLALRDRLRRAASGRIHQVD